MNTNSYGRDPSLSPISKDVVAETMYRRSDMVYGGFLNGTRVLEGQFGKALTSPPEIHEAVQQTSEQWKQASEKAATAELSAMMSDKEMIAPQGSDVANSAPGNRGREDAAGLDTVAILENIEKIRAEASN